MTQRELELILIRQLASYLAVAIFVVDPEGNLLYYNEPAEALLGRSFDETGEMPVSEWGTIFVATDAEGTPLAPESLPLVRALATGRPAHSRFWIEGLDGIRRGLDVTAFPLVGQAARQLGGVALFWEVEE